MSLDIRVWVRMGKLGFKRICLFGHDGSGRCREDSEKLNNMVYPPFSFPKKMVQILNCNPTSFISCFEKIDYCDVVERYGKDN